MDAPSPVYCVLVIDDDDGVAKLLSAFLPQQYKINVLAATSPHEGLRLLESAKVDLVVLDVMMPGMDGFDVCREIRRRGTTPILMLSARGDSVDRIVGLELGADDFMCKPFEPRELATRIKAILRRVAVSERGVSLRVERLDIRVSEREAYFEEKALGLTSMEFELLWLLAGRPGKKFSRDEIMRHLQGFEPIGNSRSVDILISRLRSKLGENARDAQFIKSVHGFGYVFIGKPS